MTRIFLNTLSQFYYEKMTASAPSDFAEMVNMGIRQEDGVREGRLVKESVSTYGFKKKDQEVSMVKGQPRQQAPQQFNPYNRVQKAPKYDLIPMKYAELLPTLLEKNLFQIRPPPRVPEKLPAR